MVAFQVFATVLALAVFLLMVAALLAFPLLSKTWRSLVKWNERDQRTIRRMRSESDISDEAVREARAEVDREFHSSVATTPELLDWIEGKKK